MNSLSRIIRRLPSLVAVVVLAHCSIAAASSATDGWQKLWSNQNLEARAAFTAALKQNPGDSLARRGLGVLDIEEDCDADALDAWAPLYKVAPAHWSALAYWPRLVDLAHQTGRWAPLEQAAHSILAAPGSAPQLRDSARLAMAFIAQCAGQTAAAEAQWSALGFVRNWRAIGPFDNVSLSGFDKPFPPEQEIAFDRHYPGKDDLDLHWRPLPLVTHDGQCDVAASLGDRGANVFYLATALFSPQEQPVLLRMDPTGATKLFINGRLVFLDDKYREHYPLVADPFQAPATLRQGWNTVLIKLADNEKLNAAIALRVTTPSGEDVKGLLVDPVHVASGPVEANAAKTVAADSTWAAPLRPHAQDPEAAIALASALRAAHDYGAAEAVLRTALKRLPDSGWLHWQLSLTLMADDQADDARSERDLASKNNPRLISAGISQLNDHEAAYAPADLIQRLKSLQAISPESALVQWELAAAYDKQGLQADALKAARAAVADNGGSESLVALAKLYDEQDRKADGDQVLATALRTAPDSQTLLQERAAMLADRGLTADAIAQYLRLLQVEPAQPGVEMELADLYRSQKTAPKAAQILRAARAQRPQDANICSRLADVLQEAGDTQGAIRLYNTAIQLDPSQVALRDKIQLLAKQQPVIDLAPATSSETVLAGAPKVVDVPGADVVMLLDEAREVVYPDYATFMRAHQIIKIMDEAGAQRYEFYPLGRSSSTETATIESARVIKADGKVVDVTHDSGGAEAAFPSLSAGDTIDVTYRTENYQRGALAHEFWSQWGFSMPDTAVKLSRYVLISPPAMPLQTRDHGPVPQPTVKDVKGWRIREWRMTNIPAVKEEVMAPGGMDFGTWLDLSTISSWSTIVKWYRDLSAPRCVPDAVVRAKALELAKGAKTDEDKLRAIVHYVAQDIHYQSTPFRLSAYVPTEGKQVVRERYGDCKDKAALLTSLLAAVGIKSKMVLLSPRDHGVTPYLPSPRFNHAIAVVDTSKGPLWVDATADQMQFGDLPMPDQGVPALIIDDATKDLTLTPVMPITSSDLTTTHTDSLSATGRLSGSVEISASADWAWMLRSAFRMVPESKRDDALRGLVSKLVESAHYEGGSLNNLSDPDKPLVIQARYHADNYGTQAGNFLLIRLPWDTGFNDGLDALTADPVRKQDLETAQMRGDQVSTLQLQLPPGYAPQDLQPEVHAQCPWGSYRITYRMDGNTLNAREEVKISPLRVPAQDVPKFLAFLRAHQQEIRKELVLKKG